MTSARTLQAKQKIIEFEDGDITALPFVYGCFAGRDKQLIRAAAAALAAKLKGLSPAQLINFLSRMSHYTSLDWYNDWEKLSLKQLRRWLNREEYFAVTAAGSAHPNGYYREKCLRELEAYKSTALPYLLLRANDWVGAIRILTINYAEKILLTCPPEDVLFALPYLYRLERGRRRSETDYTGLIALVNKRLISQPVLLSPERIQTLDRDGRRLCLRIAQQQRLYGSEQWKDLLHREKDPFTRRVAALAILDEPGWESYLTILLSHKDSSLRRLALQVIWERLGTAWNGYKHFLCDPRRGVQEWARFAVGQQVNGFDFAAYYRGRLTGEGCAGALTGLGDTGVPEDGALIKPYLQSDCPSLRKAALSALGCLCKDTELETYYHFLLCGGCCSATAFHLLSGGGMHPGCERLFKDLKCAEDPLVKRRLCVLLGNEAAWERLPYLLWLWDDSDHETAQLARHCLERWWHFSYHKPRPDELLRFRTAFREQRSLLPVELIRRLEFELAYAERKA